MWLTAICIIVFCLMFTWKYTKKKKKKIVSENYILQNNKAEKKRILWDFYVTLKLSFVSGLIHFHKMEKHKTSFRFWIYLKIGKKTDRERKKYYL